MAEPPATAPARWWRTMYGSAMVLYTPYPVKGHPRADRIIYSEQVLSEDHVFVWLTTMMNMRGCRHRFALDGPAWFSSVKVA